MLALLALAAAVALGACGQARPAVNAADRGAGRAATTSTGTAGPGPARGRLGAVPQAAPPLPRPGAGAATGNGASGSGTAAGHPGAAGGAVGVASGPLPEPAPLAPFTAAGTGQGAWRPAGRPVGGVPAVYETTLVPPGGTQQAGVAWMDTRLLAARLYSGSASPGGGPYRYTAPVQPAQASTLVAAFNGGFMMPAAHGGYYTEGRTVVPLVNGAASLVISADGSVDVGAWGTDVTMTPEVSSVRQNLVPLVAGGQPTALAASPDWQAWGATCGASSCTVPVGLDHQWRSGLGVTGDGALVYVQGPALDPLQVAQLLVRAGVVRGMELDINPDWPDFATYDPATPGGLAAPANGSTLLASTVQGAGTFFEPWWARDFVTMSARPAPGA